jgi:hypothetical protein
MVSLFFKVEFDFDGSDVDGLGADLAVFLEEYLNGEQRVDVRYIGHLK